MESPPVWTPKALLDGSTGYFAGKGIASARFDAERLLAHALGCARIDLYLNFDKPLAEPDLSRFRELVRRRAAREPVPYLTGEAGFWNLTLAIRPGCLIPRPDTETLVETVLATLRERKAARTTQSGAGTQVLELGTGSGAIPLAVCSETEGLHWIACERSGDAIAVASENRRRYKGMLTERHHRFELIRCDGFEAIHPEFTPDLIVSNPPYVATGAIAELEPEVSGHEPVEALDGGEDGLRWYRTLAEFAARLLAPGGSLLLEIGSDQAEAVGGLIALHPELRLREVRKDLEGRPRAIWAMRGA